MADEGHARAEAAAIDIDGVLTVSKAEADSDGKSTGTALSLLGTDISAGNQDGDGENGGALIPLSQEGMGGINVAEHNESVDGDHAHADASAVHLFGPDGTIDLKVLAADADADSDGGHGHSDGVYLDLGGGALNLHVLHAESDSDVGSLAGVAQINGTNVVDSEQSGNALCAFNYLDPIAKLDIVCASADEESGAVTGEVVDGDLLLDSVLADVVTTTSYPAAANPPVTEPEIEGPAEPEGLPRTGVPIGLLALLGLGALGAGERTRRLA